MAISAHGSANRGPVSARRVGFNADFPEPPAPAQVSILTAALLRQFLNLVPLSRRNLPSLNHRIDRPLTSSQAQRIIRVTGMLSGIAGQLSS